MHSPRIARRSLIGILLIPVLCGGFLLGQTDPSSGLAESKSTPTKYSSAEVPLALPECDLEFRGEGRLTAPNRHQEFRVDLTERELHFAPRSSTSSGEWFFALEQTGWGRGELLESWPDCSAAPLLDGARVRYRTSQIESWIENRECGLEHGWSVLTPPTPPVEGQPLTIELTVSGLKPVLQSDEKSVALFDADGSHILDYDSLFAWDSEGTRLPCWFTTDLSTIRIMIDDSAAIYPIEIDPVVSTFSYFSKTGEQGGSEFGFSIEGGSDLTGDGKTDLVVGAKAYDGGETDEGGVFVFAGMDGAPPSTNPAWTAVGNSASARFGESVSMVGDVNGDGIDDLLVGAPGANADRGEVHLFLGPLESGPLRTPTDATWSAEGPHAAASFGTSVAGAGDVNGDGYDDLLVGAPQAIVNGATRGRAYLYFGSEQGPVEPPLTLDGLSVGEQFGAVVASAGNFDGDPDGRSEILIAAPQRSEGAQLLLGMISSYRWDSEGSRLELILQVFGTEPQSQFGYSICGGVDIDGLGYTDLLVGAPFADSPEPHSDTGKLYLFRGESLFGSPGATIPRFLVSNSAEWEIYGDQVGETLGSSVAILPQLDEDSLGDLVSGSPLHDGGTFGGLDAGRVAVFLGKTVLGELEAGPFSGGFDSVDDDGDRVYRGLNGHFGACVASAGDLDGDGLTDLAVGASQFSGSATAEGQVVVYLGFKDCNENLVPDGQEPISEDCDQDGLPDDCEPDCDADGIPDDCQGVIETYSWSGPVEVPATGEPQPILCGDTNSPGQETVCGFTSDSVVNDLNVILDLGFDDPNFQIYLTHPSGSPTVRIYDGSGGFLSGPGLPIRFDDEVAAQSLFPAEPLQLFDFQALAGEWLLEIEVQPGQEVVLFSYSLEVRAVDVLLGDCNQNGTRDLCDTLYGNSSDCNFDSYPDECQDQDGDGVADSCDNCPEEYNLNQTDYDNDGIGNSCDICILGHNDEDADQDGIPDFCDNCPNDSNVGQEDCDADEIGDICEVDCNENGTADDCEILYGLVTDCNDNGVPDECDVLYGVTVESEPPTISGMPSDQTLQTDSGQCTASCSWTEPTATDNCELVSFESSHTPGDHFPRGETVVTYTATDSFGQSAQLSFTVTVIDQEGPTISGMPSMITVDAPVGHCEVVVSWDEPTAADNCDLSGMTATYPPGSSFPVGTTSVQYTATDHLGLSTTESFTVTVLDREAPTFTTMVSDQTLGNELGMCGATATWSLPEATDLCSDYTVSCSPPPGSFFEVGTTSVTVIATDTGGNETTTSFTVTVLDSESPTIEGTPTDIVIDAEPGVCHAAVTWVDPMALDNCDGAVLSLSHESGSTFPVGTTMVTVTATDSAWDMVQTSFAVTVEDNQVPQISGVPTDQAVSTDPGSSTATFQWNDPQVIDNCPGATLESSFVSGGTFGVGEHTVSFTATDASTNMSESSFTLTVADMELPEITTSGPIVVPIELQSCDAMVTIPMPTTSDNSGVASVTNDRSGAENPSGTYPPGSTTIIWTVTDIHGNERQAEQVITVDVALDDCNNNGIPDACDIANGHSQDCAFLDGIPDGIPDECQDDCDEDGIPDVCEADCDGNGHPDACDLGGNFLDCNENGIPDSCDIQLGLVDDCQPDGIPDSCQYDCDQDGVPDDCEDDCNQNGTPDECEPDFSADCDGNGISDICESDCDGDGTPDICELMNGEALDQDHDGIPDNCECDPPSALSCDLQPDGTALVTWEGSYNSVTVTRNGVPFAELPAGVNSVTDAGLTQQCLGTVTYEITGRCDSGGTIIEETESCSLTFTPALMFRYRIQDASVPVSSNGGASTVPVTITIEELPTTFCVDPAPTTGFSMAVAHDPQHLTPIGVAPGAALYSLPDGGPEFFSYQMSEAGWTLGVSYSVYNAPETLAFATERAVAVATYTSSCNVSQSPLQTQLFFQDELGSPPIDNLVVVSGFEYEPIRMAGTITLEGDASFVAFCRGDCNENGEVSIADAVLLLNEIFNGNMQLNCHDACDVNDSGSLNIADPLYVLSYLFQGTLSLPGGLDCALDLNTSDSLECESYDACPDPCSE